MKELLHYWTPYYRKCLIRTNMVFADKWRKAIKHLTKWLLGCRRVDNRFGCWLVEDCAWKGSIIWGPWVIHFHPFPSLHIQALRIVSYSIINMLKENYQAAMPLSLSGVWKKPLLLPKSWIKRGENRPLGQGASTVFQVLCSPCSPCC